VSLWLIPEIELILRFDEISLRRRVAGGYIFGTKQLL
jgi:hypothetical protein